MSDVMKGRGAPPIPDEWLEGSGRRLEIQTDKDAWKVIPCTSGGCDTDLVVNTFYAPAKGKCSRHDGSSSKAIATSRLVHTSVPENVVANGSLAKLDCPLCGNPLLVVKVDDSTGSISFRCTDGIDMTMSQIKEAHDRGVKTKACGTAIVIKPGLAWAEPKAYPARLGDMIEDWNVGQRVEYYDRLEAKNEPHATPAAPSAQT